jgi:hypothetical protein
MDMNLSFLVSRTGLLVQLRPSAFAFCASPTYRHVVTFFQGADILLPLTLMQ